MSKLEAIAHVRWKVEAGAYDAAGNFVVGAGFTDRGYLDDIGKQAGEAIGLAIVESHSSFSYIQIRIDPLPDVAKP
jgi:hypothetical protein